MTKMTLMAALAASLVATGAVAADLPRKSAPVAPIVYKPATPIFTWTGFYMGANAGYGWGSATGADRASFKDPTGFIGGGQIGYNHQVDRWVFGLETDLQYSAMTATLAGVKGSIPYFGTVRGRAGVAVDRFLPYLTAGFAYGGLKGSDATTSGSSTSYGWTAGAGVEYAFDRNWSAKLEGLYVNLAKKNVAGYNVGANASILRAGVNYRF